MPIRASLLEPGPWAAPARQAERARVAREREVHTSGEIRSRLSDAERAWHADTVRVVREHSRLSEAAASLLADLDEAYEVVLEDDAQRRALGELAERGLAIEADQVGVPIAALLVRGADALSELRTLLALERAERALVSSRARNLDGLGEHERRVFLERAIRAARRGDRSVPDRDLRLALSELKDLPSRQSDARALRAELRERRRER